MISLLRIAFVALPIAFLGAACSSGGDGDDVSGNPFPELRSIRLQLSCPDSISPGTTVRGLVARFTDQDGQPIPDAFVNLTANTGVISAPPGIPNSGGDETDAFGLVGFDYEISDAVPLNSVVVITAAVRNYRGASVSNTCRLAVKNSNFVITQPLDQSRLVVGTANAVPVQIQWTDERGDGVVGQVRLTTGADGTLVTTTASVRAATVTTDADGDLDGSTRFACVRRGTVTLRAEELGNASRSSTVTVTCIEAPLYLDVMVSNDEVSAAPENNRFSTFTIRPVADDNSSVPDLPITVELLTPAGGGDRILAPSITTNADGVGSSRYEAGTTAGSAEIRFCVRGSSICTVRLVRVRAAAGTSPSGTPTLALVCPSALNAGATSDVGIATVADGQRRGIANAIVTLSPSTGFINAPPDQSSSFGGNTGSDGRLPFTYRAPADFRVDTNVGIRGSTNINGTNLVANCALLVRADLFALTAPTDNTEQALGTAAARNVGLLWQKGDLTNVVGPVTLEATNNAKLTTDISQAGAGRITLNTSSRGGLENPLFFVCTQSGTVELRATADQSTFPKTSTVNVQCVDPPTSITARVTPESLNRDPSNNRTAEATFTLRGQSGSNVRNADITFTLLERAGGDDLLLNSSGVTDDGGSAIARYKSGSAAGRTVIQGCLRGSTTLCEKVTITVL